MSRIVKILFLWFVTGMCYFVLEGLWNIPKGGYANIIMLPVGGLCGLLVGCLNQYPPFYKLKMVYQSLMGAVIVLAVEFVSGLIINVWLGLGIWDYSHMPYNLMGQICPLFGVYWFLLMPLAIWLEDFLRWKFWKEGKYYSPIRAYVELFTFQ